MFSLFRNQLDSVKVLMSLVIVSLVWIASLILPHFQPGYSIPFLILSALLFLLLILSLRIIPVQNVTMSLFHLRTLGIIFAFEIVLLLLASFKITAPYLFFSRLGSYSMFSNGQLMVFGDLRHLTSVVHCPVEIQVGLNICDVWGRHFNQNPDVGNFFRWSAFSNAEILGLISTSIFFFVILISLGKYKPSINLTVTIFFTPPIVLAIDRGNEIITVSLILMAVLINDQWKTSNMTLAFLALASIFKFWPFVLLMSWAILSKAFSNKKVFIILLTSVAYLVFHFRDLQQITHETQQGDANGGSFGIGLVNFLTVYGWVSVVLILMGTIFLLKINSDKQESFNAYLRGNPLLVSLMISYLGLFLAGIHFNYRLIILLPISILLWKDSQNMNLVMFILALMITSRLNIVSVTTPILFIYFTYVLSRYFRSLIHKTGVGST